MSNSPTVKDLKASFEARSVPAATPSTPPAKVELTANADMFPKKFSNPLKSSIDSVLDTAKGALQTPSVTLAAPPAPSSPTPATPPTQAPTTPAPSAAAPPASISPTAAPTDPAPPSPAPAQASASPVLTVLSAPIPVRLASLLRPFWIGPPRPERPVTPGAVAMTQPVTIEYTSPGLQPPVYVFTSLSDPQWDAIEMDSQKKDEGEYHFSKSFTAEEGDYQYKFRLGPGDWWALNDSEAVVDDGAGNKNNLLVVKPAAPVQPSQQPAPTAAEQPPPAVMPAVQAPKTAEQPKTVSDTPRAEPPQSVQLPTGPPQSEAVPTPAPAPLMPHEAVHEPVEPVKQPAKIQRPTSIPMPPVTTLSQPLPTPQAVTPAPAPLMKHETFFAAPVTVADATDVEPEYDYTALNNGDENQHQDENTDDDDDGPPLLRHESFAPDSVEHTQAPLLRHESGGIGEHIDHDDEHDNSLFALASPGSQHSSIEDSVAPEADPNDPSLERFPTDHHGIFEHIRRASTQLAENDARGDSCTVISSHSSVSPVASLPSVQEDEDEELEELRDAERLEADKEAEDDKVDPMAPAVMITEPDQRPTAPITPPMTPMETEKIIERVIEAQQAEQIVESILAVEQVEEAIEKAVETDQAGAGAEQDARNEKVVVEFEQQRGLFGTFADLLTHPMAWFAIAGIAVAVAAGVWKLR